MSVASPAPRVSLSLGGGLLRFAAPSTGDPGSRRGPLGSPRARAPARCRFRSTRFLPRSTGRLVDPPASPRVPGTGRGGIDRTTGAGSWRVPAPRFHRDPRRDKRYPLSSLGPFLLLRPLVALLAARILMEKDSPRGMGRPVRPHPDRVPLGGAHRPRVRPPALGVIRPDPAPVLLPCAPVRPLRGACLVALLHPDEPPPLGVPRPPSRECRPGRRRLAECS